MYMLVVMASDSPFMNNNQTGTTVLRQAITHPLKTLWNGYWSHGARYSRARRESKLCSPWTSYAREWGLHVTKNPAIGIRRFSLQYYTFLPMLQTRGGNLADTRSSSRARVRITRIAPF
jgi:hypothetical protein